METLSSFWKKLTLGTYVKVSYIDHARSKGGVSAGKIVKVQTNAVARDGNNYDNTKQFTKESPCYFRKPKASEVEISENKLTEFNERCATTVIYEIIQPEEYVKMSMEDKK